MGYRISVLRGDVNGSPSTVQCRKLQNAAVHNCQRLMVEIGNQLPATIFTRRSTQKITYQALMDLAMGLAFPGIIEDTIDRPSRVSHPQFKGVYRIDSLHRSSPVSCTTAICNARGVDRIGFRRRLKMSSYLIH